MLDCNRRDMELVSTVTSASKTGSVMDLQQTGGLDCARFVVTSTAASAVLEIQGCDKPDGSFEKVLEVTVSAAGEAYRERVPVACPRFVRLVATTLDSGSAELSYRV